MSCEISNRTIKNVMRTKLSLFRGSLAFVTVISAFVVFSATADAQNYERYKPLDLQSDFSTEALQAKPDAEDGDESTDDRELVDRLDAVVIVDSKSKIQKEASIDDLIGVHVQMDSSDSLMCSPQAQQIINRYIGLPITLRRLGQMTKELNQFYRDSKLPIVDIQVPEQRITGGTVHLVVVESRLGQVKIRRGKYFSHKELSRWVGSARPGNRIYEPCLEKDLLWLNQNSFRQASVDFKKGVEDGTTDVIYEIKDYRPFRFYSGVDDSGVDSLNFGRFFAGFQYGNLLGRGATLGYQFTADEEFRLLEAHSVSIAQPINRSYSLMSYGSWAGVSPELNFGLTQDGESWQLGSILTRHLIKERQHQRDLTMGVEFKSTNNNLEFAGSSVSASNADLFQLRFGFDDFRRNSIDDFERFRFDTFIGPGVDLTGGNNATAFSTLRPDTSPDYIYARFNWQRQRYVGQRLLFAGRFAAQASSERLLFSETLGFGGFDTIRGSDQRVFNADHGWISSVELGPNMFRWGCSESQRSLRVYSFVDFGNGYVEDPQAGENASTFVASAGLGARFNLGSRVTARVDYGAAIEPFDSVARGNRAHFGLTWISPLRR